MFWFFFFLVKKKLTMRSRKISIKNFIRKNIEYGTFVQGKVHVLWFVLSDNLVRKHMFSDIVDEIFTSSFHSTFFSSSYKAPHLEWKAFLMKWVWMRREGGMPAIYMQHSTCAWLRLLIKTTSREIITLAVWNRPVRRVFWKYVKKYVTKNFKFIKFNGFLNL
jgi:hypothetical protein